MAGSRLCGYCRISGHRMPDCNLKAEHRNLVLSHTPKERKALLTWMVRQGYGDGAVLLLGGRYEQGVKTAILNGASWIKGVQYTGQKNKTYSKQVIVTLQDSYERNLEGQHSPKQWGYLFANAFIAGNGESGESGITLAAQDIATPNMATLDPTKGYSCALIQPSYTPYNLTAEELASNIYLSKRLFVMDSDRAERVWHDYAHVQGITPS